MGNTENPGGPDKRITAFIKKHHMMTLATCNGGESWVAHCFYAYMEGSGYLVFTSDESTKHMQMALCQPSVAVGIALETRIVGKIQGLQMQGRLLRPEGEKAKNARKLYLKRFPYARLMETSLWLFEPSYIKMTHNALGFGKKLVWPK